MDRDEAFPIDKNQIKRDGYLDEVLSIAATSPGWSPQGRVEVRPWTAGFSRPDVDRNERSGW